MSEDDYQPSRVRTNSDRFIVISGCSGSGKSSLLSELVARGHRAYIEPGRQIVKEQFSIDGDALPWQNADKFLELVLSRAMHQLILAASQHGMAFFDRGVLDVANHFFRHALPLPAYVSAAAERYRYHRKAFFSPPWPEIYRTDSERKHSFEEGAAEYGSLVNTYRSYGYEIVEIPRLSVSERADFVLSRLGPEVAL